MRRTEGRESGRMAAFEALLAVLVASAAGQGAAGNSSSGSGCINVHPEMVEVVQFDADSVWIQWKRYDLTSVTGYLIQYRSVCDDVYRRAMVNNVNTTEYNITGLYSHQLYTMRMTVLCNSSYTSTFSPRGNFTTESQRVMAAPSNVSVATLNASQVEVTWDALDPCLWSGEPVGYVVHVTDLTTLFELHQNVTCLHTAVLLVPARGRSYNVSVSAVNNIGEGPSSIPVTFQWQDVPCDTFFCTSYWYYIIALSGAIVIAVTITCIAVVCKLLCCRRKVTYAKDIEDKRYPVINPLHPHSPREEVDFAEIDSMTEANSVSELGEFPQYGKYPCDDTHIYHVPHEQAPPHPQHALVPHPHQAMLPHPHQAMLPHPHANWAPPPSYQASDSNYATLQSVGSSLNSLSQDINHSSTDMGLPRGMGVAQGATPPTVMSQSGAFPYEVPSRSSSEVQQSLPVFGSDHPSREHIYQSVGDSPRPGPSHSGPRPALSSASSLTMPSWPTSAAHSREGSLDPQHNTLPRRGLGQGEEQWSPVTEEDRFSLPPPPDHPPPPLRRSTLDLMEHMREEIHHHGSQGVLHSRALSSPSENHYHVSSTALRQPGSFPSLHSPVFSSDSSLANNGPTQTPPPVVYPESLWNKDGRSALTPIYSKSTKRTRAQSQESQL